MMKIKIEELENRPLVGYMKIINKKSSNNHINLIKIFNGIKNKTANKTDLCDLTRDDGMWYHYITNGRMNNNTYMFSYNYH